MAKKKKHLGYVPFTPPTGSYDPTLDAAERAGGRGLQDLIDQLGTAYKREATTLYDPGIGTIPEIQRQQVYGQQDLSTALARENRDYSTQKGQLQSDYGQQTANIGRSYANLAAKQTQGAAAAGVAGGGALSQALAKRTANQGLDQGQADQSFQRANSALDTQHGDYLTGNQTSLDRLNTGAATDLGRADYGFAQSNDNRGAQRRVAEREQLQFGLDTQTARLGQVRQNAPDYYQRWVQQNHKRGFALNGDPLKKPGRYR